MQEMDNVHIKRAIMPPDIFL